MTVVEPTTWALDHDTLRSEVAAARASYAVKRPKSAAAQERAVKVLPGGNTRSVLHFAPFPFRVGQATGVELIDIDGHRVVDFCGNYTASLLGHRPALVRNAIMEVLDAGWAIGAVGEREIELAELLCGRFPAIESVRFTNSGTEANLMAIATAMHVTGRTVVGVFDHGYHGGVLSFGDYGGPHHPLNAPYAFHVAPFNDPSGLDALFAANPACVVIEAVQGSGGCRPADPSFLLEVQRRCQESGTLFILDEVMTSRLGPSGAQGRFGLEPDLTTLGKYLAGGLSFGAFGGRRDILDAFNPATGGALTQAGTFNNNALSMAASLAVLRHGLPDDAVRAVNDRGDRLREGLNDTFQAAGCPMWVTGLGSMLCAHSSVAALHELWFLAMLDAGHFIARRGFMALSLEITDAHVAALIASTATWCAEHES
jgi:glutamate-1-semialdehyde 2,1-aminomutase